MDDLLTRIPLLAPLHPDARRELARQAVRRTFAPDQVLWRAGDAPRGLFLLLEGEVRVVRAVGGRQHVVHVERAGGTLGDVPFFEGGRYPATAIAACRTECLVLSRGALEAAVRRDPALAFALLGRLAARVRHLIDRLDDVTHRSVPARLAAHLLARHDAAGGGPFTLGRTQAEVAEELGTVREVLVRALRGFRERGLLEPLGNGRFRLPDPAALRAAQGDR